MGLLSNLLGIFSDGPTLRLSEHREQAIASASTPVALSPGSVALERAYGPRYSRKIVNNDQRDGIRTPWVPVQPRWLPEEVDAAWTQAEQGNLRPIAGLIEAMRGDGTISGLMRTRTSMVRLPTIFAGDPYLCSELQGVDPEYNEDGVLISEGVQGAFNQMCPVSALIDLVHAAVMAGVAVAELVDDPKTGLPVLTPRDLHFLRYDWGTREWIYFGGQDSYVVDPGNGRWVLFMPDSENRPWKCGAWLPCALAFVTKIAAVYDRLRWQAQLADPLKYFETTGELSSDMRDALEDFLANVWMRAPGIVLPSGAKAGLVESTGRGYDVYQQAEQWGESQIAKALAGGQDTTSEGGMGFGDGDIFSEIAENIIQGTAASLSQCITQQVIKPWALRKYPYRLARNGGVPPTVTWDVRSPARRAQEAEVLGKMSESLGKANLVLNPQGLQVNASAFYLDSGLKVPIIPLGPAPSQSAFQGQLSPAPAPLEGADDGASEPDNAALLAEKMTAHGIDRCPHGATNRCRFCGIERVQDFTPGLKPGDGKHSWNVQWKPLGGSKQPLLLPQSVGTVGETP